MWTLGVPRLARPFRRPHGLSAYLAVAGPPPTGLFRKPEKVSVILVGFGGDIRIWGGKNGRLDGRRVAAGAERHSSARDDCAVFSDEQFARRGRRGGHHGLLLPDV